MMETHFLLIFSSYSILGQTEGYGCKEQLSSPMAMQQWQDGPTHILEAADHIHRFSKAVPPCARKNIQTELKQKSSILHTQIPTVQPTQISILLAQFQVVSNEIRS